MTDVVSAEVRSRMMARVRTRNTRPELLVRTLLHRRGFRFRLHRRDLPGVPDIVLPRYRLAIFVHGCFWHQHPGCSLAKMPASNHSFWAEKLGRNRQRDQLNTQRLVAAGWRVLVIWECATRRFAQSSALAEELIARVEGGESEGEFAI